MIKTIRSCRSDANIYAPSKNFQILAHGIYTFVEDFFQEHIKNFIWTDPNIFDIKSIIKNHLAKSDHETPKEKFQEQWNWDAWINMLCDRNLKLEWKKINLFIRGKNPFYNNLRWKNLHDKTNVVQNVHEKSFEKTRQHGAYQKKYNTGNYNLVDKYRDPAQWNIDLSLEM